MPCRLKFFGKTCILLKSNLTAYQPTCQPATGKIARKGKDSAVDLTQEPARRVAALGIARALFLRACVLPQQRVLCAAVLPSLRHRLDANGRRPACRGRRLVRQARISA